MQTNKMGFCTGIELVKFLHCSPEFQNRDI